MRVPGAGGALIGIAVDEGWRGRGIGTSLMRAVVEAWARDRGFDYARAGRRGPPTTTRGACTSGWATGWSRTPWVKPGLDG